MDEDRDKPGAPETTEAAAPAEAGIEAPATSASVAGGVAPEPAAEGPKMTVSDEMLRLMAEAEAAVSSPKGPAPAAGEPPFDPNRPASAPAEPPPPELSKKEMELKMQILDLRSQLRDKDKEIEQRLKEVKQNADQARMLQGQLEGYKVRTQREKADWFNYGHEPVLKELLQVVDNLERALSHVGKDADAAAICTGVEMIQRQLLSVLAKFGATQLDSQDQPFNPEVHQAMSQVERDDVPAGTVVEELQKGYRLKDRLLRPAMVMVSRKSEAAAAVEAKTAGKKEDSAGGD